MVFHKKTQFFLASRRSSPIDRVTGARPPTSLTRTGSMRSATGGGWNKRLQHGGFHKWGYFNSWIVYKWKVLLKWMIWRYPYFGKPPHGSKTGIGGQMQFKWRKGGNREKQPPRYMPYKQQTSVMANVKGYARTTQPENTGFPWFISVGWPSSQVLKEKCLIDNPNSCVGKSQLRQKETDDWMRCKIQTWYVCAECNVHNVMSCHAMQCNAMPCNVCMYIYNIYIYIYVWHIYIYIHTVYIYTYTYSIYIYIQYIYIYIQYIYIYTWYKKYVYVSTDSLYAVLVQSAHQTSVWTSSLMLPPLPMFLFVGASPDLRPKTHISRSSSGSHPQLRITGHCGTCQTFSILPNISENSEVISSC